jgi:nucleoside-diphosphate-sugar epimerase
VTGGLGFVGVRLCHTLLDLGATVRCVDNLSGAHAPDRGLASADALAARGAEVLVEDAAPAHVRTAGAVVHLAGLPGVRSRHSPAVLRQANVELPARLARAARRQGARFLFVSSSSVYGDAVERPTPEHAELAPLNPYAESKVAAEQAVLADGGDALVARPFTVYGPGQRPEMAFARWVAAIGRAEPVPWLAAPGTARDFTYVDDVVAGLVAALQRGRRGQAYNLSGWRSVELREALSLFGPVRVRELDPAGGEARVTAGCGRKAAAELGYAPRVDLRTGVARQLAAVSSGRLAA